MAFSQCGLQNFNEYGPPGSKIMGPGAYIYNILGLGRFRGGGAFSHDTGLDFATPVRRGEPGIFFSREKR